ncbi:hypothetical protein NFI96_006491 [Prochilodus magdalenae]|nr:hypothetical protein NFI96_006491 [Prochilodus magdalenae]
MDTRRSGVLMVPYSLSSLVGERRLVAWYQVGGAQRGEQDLYRCITQSSYGAAVSNFAELIVRGRRSQTLQVIAVQRKASTSISVAAMFMMNGPTDMLQE